MPPSEAIRPADLAARHPELDFLVDDPDLCSEYMLAAHRDFYRFAASRTRGLRVLDAGCGTGIGTEILAGTSSRAVGVDVKPLVLRYAARAHAGSGALYAAMDAGRLGFPDGSFDAVVVDELLEHLPDHRPFLDEAARVLTETGTFVCATVNAAHTFGTTESPRNPHHFREFDVTSFRSELEERFGRVAVFGQGVGSEFRRYLRHPVARAAEWLLVRTGLKPRLPPALRIGVRSRITGARPPDRRVTGAFPVTDRNVDESLYLVAVATERKVP